MGNNSFTLSTIMNDENVRDIISKQLDESTQELFLNMFNLPIELGPPIFTDQTSDEEDFTISGSMGIFQEKLEGYLLLSFDRESVISLFSLFYDSEFTSISEIVMQGVSEMTNILFGAFKKIFIDRGYNFNSELPSFIYGSEHYKSFYQNDFSKLTYPILLKDHKVSLNILFKNSPSNDSKDIEDSFNNLDAIWRT